ncbi:hypothetical protein HRbin09_00260 [bacterium HR09]|nr:hypothetical protein HRbin09_00260 [bacterium HR09]
MRCPWHVTRAWVWFLALVAAPVSAQISPGQLSKVHAELDRNDQCKACHEKGKGVSPALCLGCHRALAERLALGRGFHAKVKETACERCHPEHGGRSFALVDFGPGGEEGFDHGKTGYALRGAHAKLRCRRCHEPRLQIFSASDRELAINRARTFLGLPVECSFCHRDPHNGQLGPSCTRCHGETSWKINTFDHDGTRFALKGAHRRQACDACHRGLLAAQSKEFTEFRGKKLPECRDCHRDPHNGKLGSACSECHNEERFSPANRAAFDHSRTAYPLGGKHRNVTCERCHIPGKGWKITGFTRCESCHGDPHAGQLTAAGGRDTCERCHSVSAFIPARFGITDHEKSRFPLRLAHRAVPCPACHPRRQAAFFTSGRSDRGKDVIQFRLADVSCAACHADPHRGSLKRFMGERGCEACHDEASWSSVRFNHNLARMPLTGSHVRAACAACHRSLPDKKLVLAPLPAACGSCHKDPHDGQFGDGDGGGGACDRCHGTESFRPASRFDHRQTRFALDGAHRQLGCSDCHREVRSAASSKAVVRYRPLPITCAGCHGGELPGGDTR